VRLGKARVYKEEEDNLRIYNIGSTATTPSVQKAPNPATSSSEKAQAPPPVAVTYSSEKPRTVTTTTTTPPEKEISLPTKTAYNLKRRSVGVIQRQELERDLDREHHLNAGRREGGRGNEEEDRQQKRKSKLLFWKKTEKKGHKDGDEDGEHEHRNPQRPKEELVPKAMEASIKHRQKQAAEDHLPPAANQEETSPERERNRSSTLLFYATMGSGYLKQNALDNQ